MTYVCTHCRQAWQRMQALDSVRQVQAPSMGYRYSNCSSTLTSLWAT